MLPYIYIYIYTSIHKFKCESHSLSVVHINQSFERHFATLLITLPISNSSHQNNHCHEIAIIIIVIISFLLNNSLNISQTIRAVNSMFFHEPRGFEIPNACIQLRLQALVRLDCHFQFVFLQNITQAIRYYSCISGLLSRESDLHCDDAM